MIVARITDQNKNRNAKTTGSSKLKGYECWFPLLSASFSFTSESSTEESLPASDPSQARGRPKKKDRPQNVVECSKPIDVATSDLMYLSVFDKLKDRQGTSKEPDPLAADIHFLEVASGSLEASKKTGPVPYLKVALEEVTLESWALEGSGDERPSESFQLKFEKIAIQYIAYDGEGNMLPTTARGFSQTELTNWIPADMK
ncbi:MAG: hypothetical protein AAGG48_16560 [Planctomycetota bacterium]